MKEEIYVGIAKDGDKLNVKYIFFESFDFLLLWEFLSSRLHSIKDRRVTNS